ncbi:ABC transporter substrate-binding protein [Paenibacillus arenosi]|uniref:Extracellular solute-binding protein n=1 Tax=Paenibacillus arenosi TaxID=2774142 RepID=A0ABR9B1H0_9BACL|nr:extracellular solute-binding protein [Paenibacillus arenosi]MBD8500236.1 extracellular solute-binding protein [Paenibacillus arenosi]
MLSRYRHWKKVIIISLVVVLLTACTGGNKSELPPMPESGEGTIRVLYWNEEQFMKDYGSSFNVKYPDIEFEVVSTGEMHQSIGPDDDYHEKMLAFVKDKRLDVVILHQGDYERFSSDGLLYKIDSLIEDEKYPIDDFHPGVIDLLREKGGNALYGLAAHFSASALFYNVDLFKEYGVELPRHKMSVNEVLELAARFDNKSQNDKDRIYGFDTESKELGHMLINLADMSNLLLVDPKAEKIVMDSEAWKTLFFKYAELVKGKKLNYYERASNVFGPGFYDGKAAMMIGEEWSIGQMKTMQYLSDKNGKKHKAFEWGMVTIPVDPSRPDESKIISLASILSMMKDAPNKRASWEFIKFSAGIEMAKITGKSEGKLTTRTKYQKDMAGKSVEAFTMLKPATNSPFLFETLNKNKVSQEFFRNLFTELNTTFKDIASGKKTTEQAYEELQIKLQQQLDVAREKGAAQKDKVKK